MTTTRRGHERYQTDMVVTLTFGDETFEARTDNISLGGMHLIAEKQPPFGAVLEIRFRLPTMKEDTVCKGTVRWNRPEGFGISYDGMRAIDTWGLNQLFRQLAKLV